MVGRLILKPHDSSNRCAAASPVDMQSQQNEFSLDRDCGPLRITAPTITLISQIASAPNPVAFSCRFVYAEGVFVSDDATKPVRVNTTKRQRVKRAVAKFLSRWRFGGFNRGTRFAASLAFVCRDEVAQGFTNCSMATFEKCSSNEQSSNPRSNTVAAIQMSLVGIGLPFAFRSWKIFA